MQCSVHCCLVVVRQSHNLTRRCIVLVTVGLIVNWVTQLISVAIQRRNFGVDLHSDNDDWQLIRAGSRIRVGVTLHRRPV